MVGESELIDFADRYAETGWTLDGLVCGLDQPAVLQRIVEAVVRDGIPQHFWGGSEVQWRSFDEARAWFEAVARNPVAETWAEFCDLNTDIITLFSEIQDQRDHIEQRIIAADRRFYESDSNVIFTRLRTHPRTSQVKERATTESANSVPMAREAERAAARFEAARAAREAAFMRAFTEGRILLFERFPAGLEFILPSRAAARIGRLAEDSKNPMVNPNSQRPEQGAAEPERLCLVSGELPPQLRGEDRGGLRSRKQIDAGKAALDLVKKRAAEGRPWRIKPEALACIRESTGCSKSAALAAWVAAPEEWKRPGAKKKPVSSTR